MNIKVCMVCISLYTYNKIRRISSIGRSPKKGVIILHDFSYVKILGPGMLQQTVFPHNFDNIPNIGDFNYRTNTNHAADTKLADVNFFFSHAYGQLNGIKYEMPAQFQLAQTRWSESLI